ncbi:mitochondrial ribosomal protein S22 [Lasioglossum baleicum]|uniref:mitochondrial ribosomal protein S22 n=1 Tax=Lasioglossum baleicum TaxID=434251 RepID=UPI003FCDE683
MMFTRTNLILETLYKRPAVICRSCSSVAKETEKREPEKYFFSFHVQDILKKLTRAETAKVFRSRRDGTPLRNPVFKFMTTEQLKEMEKKNERKMNLRLQMPPVVKVADESFNVVSKDPELEGLSTVKHVFTDISFGVSNKERLIVVRELDGTLRHAFTNERSRMNQVYFPTVGKELDTPRMFSDPHLASLLEREEYEFILDRACIQFEPNDPEYHRITKIVYEDVNSKRKYEPLRSTRHFGPLAFHLAWERKIDNLLIDVIHGERLDEAAALIKLYHIFYPTAVSAPSAPYEDEITVVRNYAKLDSTNRKDIDHALLVYEKLQAQKQEIESTILKAHGKTGVEVDNPDTPPQS